MTGVVDIHHHFLPPAVFERLKREAGGAPRLVNDRLSLTLSEDLPDVDAHLRCMTEGGVHAAILTYSGVSTLGPDVCRLLNDGLAEVQRSKPEQLYGAAHAYLKDPAAPHELERGIGDLGLVAIALPTTEGEMGLDDPSLDPLWSTIENLDVPIILHPTLLPRGATTDYGLERACARPFDTTIAAARLAYGVLPGHPKLTFVLPHLGGTSVFLRGRMAMFFPPQGRQQQGMSKTQREQRAAGTDRQFEERWSRFYVDTAGTGGWAPAGEMTARGVGTQRMLFGSDYPLESHSGATVGELVDMVRGLPLPEQERERVLGGNAQALFRLSAAAV